jgi:hypothetical protein
MLFSKKFLHNKKGPILPYAIIKHREVVKINLVKLVTATSSEEEAK